VVKKYFDNGSAPIASRIKHFELLQEVMVSLTFNSIWIHDVFLLQRLAMALSKTLGAFKILIQVSAQVLTL
jgi:hypothetical protein